MRDTDVTYDNYGNPINISRKKMRQVLAAMLKNNQDWDHADFERLTAIEFLVIKRILERLTRLDLDKWRR